MIGDVSLTDGIVHRLVDGWLHPTPLIRNVPNLCNLPSSVIAKTELDKFALFVQLVDCLQSLLKRHGPIWRMQVEDVHSVSTQFLQRGTEVLFQRLRLVNSGLVGIHLSRKSEASVLPFGIAGPALLLATNIHASRINLVIAFRLEIVKMLREVVKVCNTGSR